MTVGPTPLASWRERRQQVTEGWPHRCLNAMLAALTAAGYSGVLPDPLLHLPLPRMRPGDLRPGVRSYADFRPGISVIKGVRNGSLRHRRLASRFPQPGVLHQLFCERNTWMAAAAAAVSAVPSGVTVAAAGGSGPHLSARDTVLLWGGQNPPRWEPRAVADVGQREFTVASIRAGRPRASLLRRHGYLVTSDRRGYIVLHRRSGQQGAGPSQARAK